ncbi:MAG: extracellular solute-binding protein [Anaerolineae bacterium]
MTQGIDFDRLIKKYMQEYPEVQIELIPIPGEEAAWQPMVQKMQLAAQNKQAPWDIVIGPTPFLEPGAMAPLGLLTPLDDLLPKEVFDDIYKAVNQEIRWTGDGKAYTFPWWSDVFGLIYRPSMLKEAVGTEKPPTTWDEVLTYAEKIKAKYGDQVAAFGADWNFGHRMFLPMLNTFAQKTFTDEGVLNLDDPGAKKTLEYMAKLYPYMPATSAEPLGSSKAFQSGAVAMEIYWQTQMLRAIQAGQPADDIVMTAFPKGDRVGTIFWTAGALIPTYSANKEAALHFMIKGMYDYEAVYDTVVNDWKITPFRSAIKALEDKGVLPAWAPDLLPALDVTEPIPCNPYFLNVENPLIKEELEKMFLQGQSLDDTLANLKTRITEGVKEMQ